MQKAHGAAVRGVAPGFDLALLRVLLRSVAARALEGEARRPAALSGYSEAAWRRCVDALVLHGMAAPVWGSLLSEGGTDSVPAAPRERLREAHREACVLNGLLSARLSRVLGLLADQGVEPLVLKGAALLNWMGPDLAARPMRDLDLLIRESERDAADRVMRQAGLSRDLEEPCATYYRDGPVLLDLHHRFAAFGSRDLLPLTHEIVPRFLQRPAIRVFEANAMLAHLARHLSAHVPTTGYVLLWVMDIGLLLLREKGIEEERLCPLLDGPSLLLVRRLMAFFRKELDIPLRVSPLLEPGPIQALALGEALRSVRLAYWGLPRWKGYGRYCAHLLGIRTRRAWPALQGADLLLGPWDRLRAWSIRPGNIPGGR